MSGPTKPGTCKRCGGLQEISYRKSPKGGAGLKVIQCKDPECRPGKKKKPVQNSEPEPVKQKRWLDDYL